MTSACRVEMLPEPMEAALEDIESGPLDVFFALGIVNPFGPTLSFVGAAGKSSRTCIIRNRLGAIVWPLSVDRACVVRVCDSGRGPLQSSR